ncbi:hypothetical protein FRC02_011956 [Tulasnella sp. 418]|nr:hypothetical protein FRC02_011956 [Tulasnella sp. 418]
MTTMNNRSPYRGTELGLAISIDFGTTFSGTSWAFLDPNQIPQIWDVSSIEGQEYNGNSTKVPTVLFYDKEGNLQAAGGETLDPQIVMDAQIEEWIRVEWFKLLLSPDSIRDELDDLPPTQLPPNKTLIEVVADFLRYMAKLAQTHFLEKMVGSKTIWKQVKNRVQYVLSHPNGWDTHQHSHLREAAILGKLIPDSDEGRSRIHFVSEGEASLHWCINEGLGRKNLKVGNHFVVVDAGGGTIDISSFRVKSLHPLQLQEASAAECHLAGSVFVTQAFEKFVQEKLNDGGSVYGDSDTIKRLVEDFDNKAKCTFRRKDRKTPVTFGSMRENEPAFDIMAGRLIVQGADMADFFEPSCQAAAKAVRAHVASRGRTNVVVVGGFAGSPYLFSELQRRLLDLDVEVLRADNVAAKAAANGALSYYLDHFVSARVAKWTYGVFCGRGFDRSNRKHIERSSHTYTNPVSGRKYVHGGFRVHLKKGTVVEENNLTRIPFTESLLSSRLVSVEMRLVCYRGDKLDIEFVDEDDIALFRQLCTFKATIPETALILRERESSAEGDPDITHYWDCSFDVSVSFGTTEFKCFIEWKDERGNRHRGDATAVWNEG